MTKPITKERVQELLVSCDNPFMVRCSGCEIAGHGPTGAPEPDCPGHEVVELPAEELRLLLAAYGRECEWTEAFGCWDTSCGRSEHLHHATYCPNCGGKVKVTR